MEPSADVIAIGIDVGGTKARTAAVDGAGRVVGRRDRPIDHATMLEAFLAGLVDDVADVGRQFSAGVGREPPVSIALPGPLDRRRGCVVRSINLPFLEAVPIVDWLGERLGRRPVLVNDGEAATWGEYATRTQRPRHFVHLRLGTGVACGVVAQGELLRLDADRGTHVEWLIVEDGPTALDCRCGLRGCLESLASGAALARRATELGFSDGVSGLLRAAREGDGPANAALDRAAAGTARAVASLSGRFDPSSVALGGGVVIHVPELYERVAAQLQGTPVRAEAAVLGEDAGVIGAALLALARA